LCYSGHPCRMRGMSSFQKANSKQQSPDQPSQFLGKAKRSKAKSKKQKAAIRGSGRRPMWKGGSHVEGRPPMCSGRLLMWGRPPHVQASVNCHNSRSSEKCFFFILRFPRDRRSWNFVASAVFLTSSAADHCVSFCVGVVVACGCLFRVWWTPPLLPVLSVSGVLLPWSSVCVDACLPGRVVPGGPPLQAGGRVPGRY
jgi:hypothetical protein